LHHHVHLDGHPLVRRLKKAPARLFLDETLTPAKYQPFLSDQRWQSCRKPEYGFGLCINADQARAQYGFSSPPGFSRYLLWPHSQRWHPCRLVLVVSINGQRICSPKHAEIPELRLRLAGCAWLAGVYCDVCIPVWFAHPHHGVDT
jgi:hypothetical protein